MKMDRAKAVQNLKTGQAGVYRVVAELLLRGFNAAIPIVDTGCDLIVEGLVRVQVKSGHLREHPGYPNGVYMFDFRQSPIVTGKNNIRKRGVRAYANDVEFLVLWGIEQGRFWIVPAERVAGRTLISVGPETQWHKINNQRVLSLKESGKTLNQIASELEVSRETIKRRMRGKHAIPKYPTFEVRECEGRWDFIEAYLRTAREIDGSVGVQEETLEMKNEVQEGMEP